MRLQSPSGGTVEATGDEAKRLMGCGFVPVKPDAEPKPKPTRKSKTTSK